MKDASPAIAAVAVIKSRWTPRIVSLFAKDEKSWRTKHTLSIIDVCCASGIRFALAYTSPTTLRDDGSLENLGQYLATRQEVRLYVDCNDVCHRSKRCYASSKLGQESGSMNLFFLPPKN